jgi:hypothetical protein
MEVSGQLHDLAALPPGKEPLLKNGYEAGNGGEEKNQSLILQGNK